MFKDLRYCKLQYDSSKYVIGDLVVGKDNQFWMMFIQFLGNYVLSFLSTYIEFINESFQFMGILVRSFSIVKGSLRVCILA